MKRIYFSLLCLGLTALFSCRSDSSDSAGRDTTLLNSEETAVAEPALVLPYVVSINSETQQMEIRKHPNAGTASYQAEDITRAINQRYPDIQLKWLRQEGETAYVKIEDARFLTSQSGSEGARAYMIEATFGFTEIPGIKAVNFDFEEGDHAMPGVYTRADFGDY